MLAHKMNGDILRPDHGKPLRVVVPGVIGARSVKWLKRLVVTEGPSDNWYHIYDNRVLPTMVSPEESAKRPEWWTDERYAIYDLSTNSAIAYPAHEEKVCLIGGPEKYQARGYAYGGGGRRITRVELSLDKGQSWRLADVEYAEDRYRDADHDLYGGRLDLSWRETCFCWCFWSLEIPISELSEAKDLLVRAMDESMNVQPRDMYWTVLGMMNNPWFRVVISKEGDFLRFEHPTQPALLPGGWMEGVKKAGGDLTNGYWGEKIGGEEVKELMKEEVKEISMRNDGVDTIITIDELRKHDHEKAPWFVINGEVYDGTSFLKGHPGGAQSIISAAGLDSSDEFMAIRKLHAYSPPGYENAHFQADSETAKGMMSDYHIGSLDEASKKILGEGEVLQEQSNDIRETFLQARSWTRAELHSKKIISWDTRIFTFKLQHDSQTLGLPIGQHLMIRLQDPASGKVIIRSYTPISDTAKKGYMDVLVKVYFETEQSKGGQMTKAMESLPIGHTVDFKGPIGKFEYVGRGVCTINEKRRNVSNFVMICGGSGITPIFQVFRAVMQDRDDKTKCKILNGNRLLEDILCKEDLDALVRGNEDRGEVLYTLTEAPEGWAGLKGRINGELVKQHCERNDETLVLICGPEALEKAMHAALIDQGWRDDQLLFF